MHVRALQEKRNFSACAPLTRTKQLPGAGCNNRIVFCREIGKPEGFGKGSAEAFNVFLRSKIKMMFTTSLLFPCPCKTDVAVQKSTTLN